jgi:hypothetical protein
MGLAPGNKRPGIIALMAFLDLKAETWACSKMPSTPGACLADRPGRTRQLSDYGLWNYETAPDDSNDGGVDREPVLLIVPF